LNLNRIGNFGKQTLGGSLPRGGKSDNPPPLVDGAGTTLREAGFLKSVKFNGLDAAQQMSHCPKRGIKRGILSQMS
jgi:hypothetical protein